MSEAVANSLNGIARPLIGVTGATGFLGREIVRRLDAGGFDVVAISRSPTDRSWRTLPAPSAGESLFRDAVSGLTAIVHCAALNHDRTVGWEDLRAVNADLTGRLAEAAAAETVGRFVHVSSIRAVADPGIDAVISGESTALPTLAYGRSKRLGEELTLGVADRTGMEAKVLRLPPVYGRGMKGMMVQVLALSRMPFPLPLAGLPGRHSIVGVDAAARAAIMLATGAPSARHVHVAADAKPMSVSEMIAAFRSGAERRPGLFHVPEPLLGLLARLAGRADAWQALGATQVCDSSSLVADGWIAERDTPARLAELAR